MKRMIAKFKALHKISYVIGDIDGSHIPIIPSKLDPIPYHCYKGFYSILL